MEKNMKKLCGSFQAQAPSPGGCAAERFGSGADDAAEGAGFSQGDDGLGLPPVAG